MTARTVLAAGALLAWIAVRPCRAEEWAEEHWYGVYVGGQKAGFAVTRKSPYRIEKRVRLKLKSKGRDQELHVVETWLFANQAPHALTKARRVRNGKVVASVGGVASYTWRMHVGATDFLRGRPKDGDVFAGTAYDLAERRTGRNTIVVERTGAGRNSAGHRLRWNEAGELVVIRTATFEMRREPERVAREQGRGADLFRLGFVPVDKRIGPAEYVEKLRLRVAGAARDRVRGVAKDGTVILPARPRRATKSEIEAGLRPTSRYPLRNARLVAATEALRRKASTPEGRARAALHFVRNHIRGGLPHGEGLTALDVLESRRGDCTESAVLYVALARGLGIPAREVSGLLYLGDEKKAFGGHRWCEVVLDGVWQAVDPSWGQFRVDAAHVALKPGWLAAVRGKLRLEVLEVVADSPADDD